MNACRSISPACALAAAWLVGCGAEPPQAAATQPAASAEHGRDATRPTLMAISTDDPPYATEALSRLDSGAPAEGIRPTGGASGLRP